MNQLKPYLKPYLKETILAPLFKLFEAILELFVPLIMAVIIDKGIGNKDTTLILHQGVILICLGILGVCRVGYRSVFCGKGGDWIYR